MKQKVLEQLMNRFETAVGSIDRAVDIVVANIVDLRRSFELAKTSEHAVALLSYNDGIEEFAKLVRIDREHIVPFTFSVDRPGSAHIKLTQMGNVPIVADSIRVGPLCLCSGPTLSFKFNSGEVRSNIIVYCKVLE